MLSILRTAATLCLVAILMIGTTSTAVRAQGARPGIGPNGGTPVGARFVLPAGLKVMSVLGAREGKEGSEWVARCPDGTRFSGPSRDVEVCVSVCNYSGMAIDAIFPPGLVIVTASEGFQNGLLVERKVVRVPPKNCESGGTVPNKDPKEEKKRRTAPNGAVWIPLSAYCMNLKLNPSEDFAIYGLGPVTSDAKLLPILKLVQNRKVSTKEDVKAIQSAIYSSTDRNRPVDPEDRAKVLALPLIR